MSAHAGVFFYDRRPIDPALSQALGRWLDAFGPDGSGAWMGDGVAMVHRALHVTPEDAVEQQPQVSAHGHVITWDGRLDNRHDLLFELWRDVLPPRTDAAIVAAVYDRWGRAGLSTLVGDWSAVIVDRCEHTVTFASDYMGVRPLYVYWAKDAVWWASTLESLVEQHDLIDDLDPRFLVGTLSMAVPPGVTPYRNLATVPAGASITVSADRRHETARFWTFDVPAIRYRDARDYEGHLRHRFLRAVETRLRATSPVWAELSGGLDSSSIVGAAHILMASGVVRVPALETVSYVVDDAPEGDERRFAEAVDAFRGQQSHYLRHREDTTLRLGARSWLTPSRPSTITLVAYDLVRQSGSRLLLGGEAGDTVMGNYRDYHYDVAALLPRHTVTAVALARRRALAAQRPIWHVLRDACAEWFPDTWLASRRLAAVIERKAGRAAASDSELADRFVLRPEYVAYWREERARGLRRSLDGGDVAHRRLVSELSRVAEGRHMQIPSEEPLVLRSYPYLDRPLVEFVLGIPIDILVPPGRPRDLMRRAFAPFVPPRVLTRFSKGYASPSIVRHAQRVVAHWLQAPDHIRVAQLACVDAARLTRYLESIRDNAQADLGLFVTLFALEEWLAARAGRRHGAPVSDIPMKGGERRGVSEALA